MPFGGFDPDLEEFVTKPPPRARPAGVPPVSARPAVNASLSTHLDDIMRSLQSQGHDVRLGETVRTQAQQDQKVAQGYSRTRNSRHLTGDAGDLIVYTGGKPDWDTKNPAWQAIGAEAKARGLRWGGDFKSLYDPGHVEIPRGGSATPPAPAIDPDLEEFTTQGAQTPMPTSAPTEALPVDPDLEEFVQQMAPPALAQQAVPLTAQSSIADIRAADDTRLPSPQAPVEDEEVERVTTSIPGQVPIALPPPVARPTAATAEEAAAPRQMMEIALPEGVKDWSDVSSTDAAKALARQYSRERGIPAEFTEKWLEQNGGPLRLRKGGAEISPTDAIGTDAYDPDRRTIRVSAEMPHLRQLEQDYEASKGTATKVLEAGGELMAPYQAATGKLEESLIGGGEAALRVADVGTRPTQALETLAMGSMRAALQGGPEYTDEKVLEAVKNRFLTGETAAGMENPFAEEVYKSETLNRISPTLAKGLGFATDVVLNPVNALPAFPIARGLARLGSRGKAAGAALNAAGDLLPPVAPRISPRGLELPEQRISPRTPAPVPQGVRPVDNAVAATGAQAMPTPAVVRVRHSNPVIDGSIVEGRNQNGTLRVRDEAGKVHIVQNPRGAGGNQQAALVRAAAPTTGKAPPVEESVTLPPVRERSLPQTLEAGGLPGGTNRTYTPITNKESVATAQARVQGGGIDSAADFVLKAEKPTAEVTTTGVEVMRRLQQESDRLRATNPVEADAKMARAVEVANHLSQKLTEAGQAVQAASIVSRLSPDGILLYAERVAKKSGDVKVTPEQATALRTAATRMAGAEVGVEKAKRIVELSEKARATGTLTDAERGEIRTFVTELQPFAGDKAKASPRQSVVSILTTRLDTAEQSARARLASRAGKKAEEVAIGIEYRQAGIPVPVADIGDFAIIGAAKLARKAIKFDEWASEMMGEFGDSVKDILPRIYRAAEGVLNTEKAAARAIHKDARAFSMTLSKIEEVGRVDAPEATRLADLARSLKSLKGDARTEAAQELQGALQALDAPGLGRRISTVQTMGQLLNPKTQTRNIVGNEMFYRLERINKYPATLIDFARSKLTGSERKVTFRTAGQGEYWKNFYQGARAGAKGLNPGGITSQYDFRSPAFNSKYNPMFYLERTLKASMQGFDFAAYSRAKNQTLGELGTLKAINESVPRSARKDYVRKFIDDADAASIEIADQYGKFVTFQDDNLISGALTKVKAGLNLGKDFGVGDIVLKYPKTPGALLMRAIEYSPAGIVKGIAELKPFMKEAANVRGAEEAIARAITGTAGTTALGYFLAANGVLSSEPAEDKDAAAFKSEQTGERRYQVNTSAIRRWMTGGFSTDSLKKQKNDTLMSYDWAQPIAIGLSIGANIQKNLSSGKRADTGLLSTVTESIGGAVDTIVEQPVLQGVRDVLSDKFNEGAIAKAVRIFEGVPASFVPTFLNQIKQARDNKARITHDLNPAQRALNRVMTKIPFLADRLPEAYTTLGASKETYRNGTNSLFNVFLNPAFVDKYSIDPEIKMVLEPFEKEGRKDQFPKVAPRKVKYDGKVYELTGRELSEMQKRLGLETLKRFRAVDFEALKRSSPEDQEKELADGVKEAWETVRDEYLTKRGVELK